MPASADLLEAAAAIGRAAADPRAWRGVAEAVLRAMPGSRPHLIGWDARMSLSVPEAVAGYDPAAVAAFVAHYHAVNVHAPAFMRMAEGATARAGEMAPDALLLRSEYYADWLRPQEDLRGGALVVLARGADRRFMFGAHLPHRLRDRHEARLQAMLLRLAPLMRQALEVNRMLLGQRLEAVALRRGADTEGAAVLLLAADGALLHANPRAEALLAEGSAVAVDARGRLRLGGAAAAEGLARGLRGAPPRVALRVGREGARLEARLMPVPPDLAEPPGLPLLALGRSPALLVVVAPRAPDDAGAGRLARVLGLSRAEAEVALLLAEGLTAAEAAARRGVSVETVRSQVKAALAKLGERRASGLVARVERARRWG